MIQASITDSGTKVLYVSFDALSDVGNIDHYKMKTNRTPCEYSSDALYM